MVLMDVYERWRQHHCCHFRQTICTSGWMGGAAHCAINTFVVMMLVVVTTPASQFPANLWSWIRPSWTKRCAPVALDDLGLGPPCGCLMDKISLPKRADFLSTHFRYVQSNLSRQFQPRSSKLLFITFEICTRVQTFGCWLSMRRWLAVNPSNRNLLIRILIRSLESSKRQNIN